MYTSQLLRFIYQLFNVSQQFLYSETRFKLLLTGNSKQKIFRSPPVTLAFVNLFIYWQYLDRDAQFIERLPASQQIYFEWHDNLSEPLVKYSRLLHELVNFFSTRE